MMESVIALPNRSELRRFVRQVLSDHDRLDSAQCPFYEAIITRAGRVCGLAFELQGPRLMRSRAIWTADEHRILFYDTIGARFAEVHLSEEPDPAKIHEEFERAKSQPQPALAERSDRLASDVEEVLPMAPIQA